MNRLLLEHLPLSVLVGVLGWLAGGGVLSVPFALVMGWCIDADHLFDFGYYCLRHQKSPDWSFIRSGQYFVLNGKCFIPLHSWELTLCLIVGLGLLTQNWILAFTTGVAHMVHLLQDMRSNHMRIVAYSVIFRALHRFQRPDFW